MALLNEVIQAPLGPGYHSAAQRRLDAGLPASSGTRTWLMLLTAVLLGLLGTVAVVTLRTPDPAAAEGRAQIVERIEAAQAAGDEQRVQVEQLRADIAALEQEASESQGEARQELIAAAGMQAGAQAVQGPGVVVVLDDATTSDQAPGEAGEPERINARDLQIVVNGLWSAGAEAISINGHRMTSTSAIRYAGEAIIVDFRGLAPPYEVRAIGDPEALGRETSEGVTGAYLGELRSQLRLRADVTTSTEIQIGAAERLSTRLGTVAPPQAPEPSSTDESPGIGLGNSIPSGGTAADRDPTTLPEENR